MFLCNIIIKQSSRRTGTHIVKLRELFHKRFDRWLNVILARFTTPCGKESGSICEAGFIWGTWSYVNPAWYLLPSCRHSSNWFVMRLPFPRSTCEKPMGTAFMNLKTTLLEAEGHHCKSLAIAISGFSCHKVCVQNPRMDLQSDPN